MISILLLVLALSALATCTATESAATANGVDAANPLAVNAINYYGMIEQMLQQMNEPATAATARRRTASTGVDMRAMMRATQTISGQVCSGVCAKVSEDIDNAILKAILPCSSVCDLIDVALQSMVGMILQLSGLPPINNGK